MNRSYFLITLLMTLVLLLNVSQKTIAAAGPDEVVAVIGNTVGALLDDAGRLAILPSTARAIHEVPDAEWAAYAPIAGTPEFVRAVIDDIFSLTPELADAACGVAKPGGTAALRHAIANFLEPGQKLLTTSYYWGPYQTLADEGDRGIETFRMFDDGGGLDVTALDAALGAQLAKQGRALIFLNDPCHNPTGYSMSMEEWEKVRRCSRATPRRLP